MATTAAEAHQLGAESFSVGFSSKQNPFTEASEFFAEWSAGWLKAKKAEGDQK